MVENAVIELENINHEENYLGMYLGQLFLSYSWVYCYIVFPGVGIRYNDSNDLEMSS